MVSVLMPAFNGGKFIRASLDSVLEQTFRDFEVIVVDDCSTDDTADVVRSFDDSRIRLFQNEVNRGISPTRNRCIREARGELLAWLDCDDLAAPNRLEKHVRFLKRHPTFGMIGSWVGIIDQKGNSTGRRLILNAPSKVIPSLMLFRCAFQQSALTMRRSVLPADYHYDESFVQVEDFEFFVRLLRRAPGWNLPEMLCSYRRHGQNVTITGAEIVGAGIRRVLHRQLEHLGMEANDEETYLHMALGNLEARRRLDPDAGHEWLQRLLAANTRAQVYDANAFAYVIAERWLYLCWAVPGTRAEKARRFLRAPLLRATKISIRVWTELLLRNLAKKWWSDQA